MLTNVQLKRLNDQISNEAEVSRFYLSISRWAATKGLVGTAAFFKNHHELEENHMHKLEDYVIAIGGKVVTGALKAPPQEFKGVIDILKLSLKKEVEVSKSINAMVASFLQEKNFSTFQFLQWYVAEQHEEENLFRTLIDKATLIGEQGRGVYWIDKELGSAAAKSA